MADLFNMPDPVLGLPALLSFVLGLLCLLMFARHLGKHRPLRAGFQGLMSLALLGGAAVLFLAGLNLHTYQRLTHEQPVADLRFLQLGPQQYRARLVSAAEPRSRSFRLHGDEWQLDARVLRWKPPVTLLGLNARYRLERLSGRYRDIGEQRERPPSVHGLAKEAGLDLWSILGDLQAHIDWIDAYYGSAAYLPMADEARFEIVLSQSGLVARPVNEAARRAVRGW